MRGAGVQRILKGRKANFYVLAVMLCNEAEVCQHPDMFHTARLASQQVATARSTSKEYSRFVSYCTKSFHQMNWVCLAAVS